MISIRCSLHRAEVNRAKVNQTKGRATTKQNMQQNTLSAIENDDIAMLCDVKPWHAIQMHWHIECCEKLQFRQSVRNCSIVYDYMRTHSFRCLAIYRSKKLFDYLRVLLSWVRFCYSFINSILSMPSVQQQFSMRAAVWTYL